MCSILTQAVVLPLLYPLPTTRTRAKVRRVLDALDISTAWHIRDDYFVFEYQCGTKLRFARKRAYWIPSATMRLFHDLCAHGEQLQTRELIYGIFAPLWEPSDRYTATIEFSRAGEMLSAECWHHSHFSACTSTSKLTSSNSERGYLATTCAMYQLHAQI